LGHAVAEVLTSCPHSKHFVRAIILELPGAGVVRWRGEVSKHPSRSSRKFGLGPPNTGAFFSCYASS
jgi:hypothetical protein